MSFFGGGRGAQPTGVLDQNRLTEAAMEIEAVTDMFNRLVSSCHAKCISTRYTEAELNKGESVCIDRWVACSLLIHQMLRSLGTRVAQVCGQVLFRQRKSAAAPARGAANRRADWRHVSRFAKPAYEVPRRSRCDVASPQRNDDVRMSHLSTSARSLALSREAHPLFMFSI